MPQSDRPSVCIVGAGSMGIVTGYHLALGGADVTFLVRPHHRERLSRPQSLYSYDNHTLTQFSGYGVLTDPVELAAHAFDFVVITLDGAALRADAGRKLVDEIGRSYRETETAVILGSAGIDHRSWFLERSRLSESQVTSGSLSLLAHEVAQANLPLHPGTKPELLDAADYAYRHLSPFGFTVDLSAPEVARGFAELYNRGGSSRCSVVSADENKLSPAIFAPLAAWELLGWPAAADIDPDDETWRLGAEAMKEFQRLRLFGPAGVAASEQTTATSVLGSLRQMERASMPLDSAAFSAYHHGGKVNGRDHEILREALRLGESEGAVMPALRTLVAKLGCQ